LISLHAPSMLPAKSESMNVEIVWRFNPRGFAIDTKAIAAVTDHLLIAFTNGSDWSLYFCIARFACIAKGENRTFERMTTTPWKACRQTRKACINGEGGIVSGKSCPQRNEMWRAYARMKVCAFAHGHYRTRLGFSPSFTNFYDIDKNYGEGGIRTLGTLLYTCFPSMHHRPLGHLSW
jgi:hypothetical protein